MSIFAIAALAGFLLFGGIKASHEKDNLSLKPWVQGLLGSLVLFVLLLGLIVLMFPSVGRFLPEDWWSEYLAVRIIQDLTGTETAQIILGAAFGCLLRYWGPHFWDIRVRPGTRYNWVAISLVGLILLAAASPYLGSLLRNSGMTGLKTPIAELQFEGMPRAENLSLLKETRDHNASLRIVPNFALRYKIISDCQYLNFFPPNKEVNELAKICEKSSSFIEAILVPLNKCAWQAYKNYMDTEGLRHALSPVAQEFRRLIKQGRSQNSTPATDPLRDELMKSFDLLAKTSEKEKCALKLQSAGWLNLYDDPTFLANAPHIYLALALLDGFNDNREGGIFILKQALNPALKPASEWFGQEEVRSPGILFNIHFTLARYLYDAEHDPENIFLHLDKALKIAQDARDSIGKWKRLTTKNDPLEKLLRAEKRFKKLERWAKNFLAYFSAQEGARKFEALLYAKENYENIEKLDEWTKPQSIDTYGYAKMAFAARKVPPDFDEIKEAKALFKEALSHTKSLSERTRYERESKRMTKKIFRFHLQEADRLLKGQ